MLLRQERFYNNYLVPSDISNELYGLSGDTMPTCPAERSLSLMGKNEFAARTCW